MNNKKKIGVTASSIVGLKAELFRKQEQFKKEKLDNQNVIHGKLKPKKPSIWNKQNTGVEKRARKDRELNDETGNDLDKSRSALEAKAALYDEMSKGKMLPEDDDLYMVDFTQKIMDKHGSRREGGSDEEDINDNDLPDAADPDEEWVDYVDLLGRSRRCMRKDLAYLQQMDRDLKSSSKPSTTEEPDLMSEDMRREMLRQKWEQEEEAAAKAPVGPVHYQNVKFNEVRHLGVGYFGFSKEESERQKQFEQLDMLRDETVEQRLRREKLKEKRKAAVQARLEKVKQRKKLKGDIMIDLESKSEKERPAAVELLKRDETLPQAASMRPWDKGKITAGEKKSTKLYDDLRDQRPAEFAPPVEYFSDRVAVSKKTEDFKSWKSKHPRQHDTASVVDGKRDAVSTQSKFGKGSPSGSGSYSDNESRENPYVLESNTARYPGDGHFQDHALHSERQQQNQNTSLDDALSYFRQMTGNTR